MLLWRLLRDLAGEALIRAGERVRGPLPEGEEILERETGFELVDGPISGDLTEAGERMRARGATPPPRPKAEKPKPLSGSREARIEAARTRARG